jgi:hypothetical protein
MIYLIKDLTTLQKLEHDPVLKNQIRQIQIAIPGVEKEVLEQKINRYYFTCGCKEGAIGIYAAALTFSIIQYGMGIQLVTSWKVGVLVLFVSALTGKLMGLIIGKERLRQIYRKIRKHVLATYL